MGLSEPECFIYESSKLRKPGTTSIHDVWVYTYSVLNKKKKQCWRKWIFVCYFGNAQICEADESNVSDPKMTWCCWYKLHNSPGMVLLSFLKTFLLIRDAPFLFPSLVLYSWPGISLVFTFTVKSTQGLGSSDLSVISISSCRVWHWNLNRRKINTNDWKIH